jgi:hypothetical protein
MPRRGNRTITIVRAGHDSGRAAQSSAKSLILSVIAGALVCGVILTYYLGAEQNLPAESDEGSPQGASLPNVNSANLCSTGKSSYFNVEPGYRLRYRDGQTTRTVTVLRKTKFIDGVETRVVEQRDESNGRPTKIAWKYYAIDKTTHALYCFGVHVQTYSDGKLVDHRSWYAGVHGATFTLVIPAAPKVGDKFVHQHGSEKAKAIYEVIDVAEKVVTPAGTFTNCLHTQYTKAGDGHVDHKVYAPGVGLVKDGGFALVKIAITVPKKQSEVEIN